MEVWERLAGEGFEDLTFLSDDSSGLRAVLAVHDTSGGPAFGGIRRATYPNEGAAIEDALRLALAMTRKCVLVSMPAGGAKMVIADHAGLDAPAAYRAVGDLLERLDGRWFAGPDAGTGWSELDQVALRTRYVTRRPSEGPGLLGEATAAGVYAGIRAGLAACGEDRIEGRHVVVQGLGTVGFELARKLLREGARVTGSDPRPGPREALADEPGFEAVEVGEELGLDCDVFAPCALGGVLDERTIPRLRASVVCGAANGPCGDSGDPERLHARGILWVPDVTVTAGAVLRGFEHARFGRELGLDAIEERIG